MATNYNRIAEIASVNAFDGTDATGATLAPDYQNGHVEVAQNVATKTVVTITMTHVATSNGNIVMLDGGLGATVVNIAVVTTDTLAGLATKIAAGTYANMTVTAVGPVLTLTASGTGNLAGFPGISTAPAGVTYTESVLRGSYLDRSMKETLFNTLTSDDVKAGTVKIYYNAEAPVEVILDGTEDIAGAIVKMKVGLPTTHIINSLTTASATSGTFIIQNKTAGNNEFVIQDIDFGLTEIVASPYRGYTWEQGMDVLGSAVFAFEDELQRSQNAYKDTYICTIYNQVNPNAVETQRTEVWAKSKFEKYWVTP